MLDIELPFGLVRLLRVLNGLIECAQGVDIGNKPAIAESSSEKRTLPVVRAVLIKELHARRDDPDAQILLILWNRRQESTVLRMLGIAVDDRPQSVLQNSIHVDIPLSGRPVLFESIISIIIYWNHSLRSINEPSNHLHHFK